MTRQEEIIWLAGLLEGEGYFHARPGTGSRQGWRPGLVVSLEMTDRDVIERALLVFSSNSKLRTCKSRKDTWQDSYHISWYGAQAEEVMRAVLPFMGNRRRERILESLATPNLSHKRKAAA